MLSHISYVYRDILLAYGLKRWAPNPKVLGKPQHPTDKATKDPFQYDFVKSAYDGLQVTLREKLSPINQEMTRAMNANSTFNPGSTAEVKKAYPEMLEIIKQYRDYFMKDADFIKRAIEEVKQNRLKPGGRHHTPEISKLFADMQAVLDAQREYIEGL